eukprot:367853-Rhodomonas_salina.9
MTQHMPRQVVVADMYISGGKLPESWVPKSEADLPARGILYVCDACSLRCAALTWRVSWLDRMGLLQFRALLDNAKQRRRSGRRLCVCTVVVDSQS